MAKYISSILLVAGFGLSAELGRAQSSDVIGEIVICELYADDEPRKDGYLSKAADASLHESTSDIRVEYEWEDTPHEVRTAAEHAANSWEPFVVSDVPIRVRINWGDFGQRWLGSASVGKHAVSEDPPPGIQPYVLYTNPLYEAIAGDLFSGGGALIYVRLNSTIDWHFGTDGLPDWDETDLVSVIMHEIGHGLGFYASPRVEGYSGQTCGNQPRGHGCHGSDGGLPIIFDFFVVDEVGVPILDYPSPSLQLGEQILWGDGFFIGDEAQRVYGRPVPLAGGGTDHLNSLAFRVQSGDILMRPGYLAPSHGPGPVTCAMLKDLGWRLGPACLEKISLALAAEAIPEGEVFNLSGPYPNPFSASGTIRVSLAATEDASLELLDILGRHVRDIHVGVLPGGAEHRFEIDGSGLAAGVYIIRAMAGGVIRTRSLIVLE